MRTLWRLQMWLLAVAALAGPVQAADLDPFLPADTEAVVTINVKQILDSALVKKYSLSKLKDAVKEEATVEQVLTDLGFDPFTDLESVVTASPGGGEQNKGLIIAHGHFDVKKFEARAEDAAKEHGDILKIIKESGFTIYEVNIPDQPDALYVGIASKNVLVASPAKDYVVEALKIGAGQKKSALKSKELQSLLEKVNTNQSLWVAALGSALAKGPLANAQEVKEALEKIESLTGGITLTDGIKAEFGVAAKDAAAAKELAKTINSGLNQAKGLLALLAANQAELAPLVDIAGTVKASAKDKIVMLKGEVPADVIEKSLKKDQ